MTDVRPHDALAPWRPPASRRRAGPHRAGRSSGRSLSSAQILSGTRHGSFRDLNGETRALLSLNVESAALPERLGIIATDFLTIREGKALTIYPAIERLHNCERA